MHTDIFNFILIRAAANSLSSTDCHLKYTSAVTHTFITLRLDLLIFDIVDNTLILKQHLDRLSWLLIAFIAVDVIGAIILIIVLGSVLMSISRARTNYFYLSLHNRKCCILRIRISLSNFSLYMLSHCSIYK